MSVPFSVGGADPQIRNHRMYILLALVSVSLLVAPTTADSSRSTIISIINIAKITLFHITKLRTKLPTNPQVELSTPSIEGVTGICYDLGLLDNELQNSDVTEHLSQIRADISSLEGWMGSLARKMGCSIRPKPAREPVGNSFPDSQLYLVVEKVRQYLDTLLVNRDKLTVC
ncbi:leptin-B-like [Antennarius striatus]|uniref:leptin-B-like n=1 Tax=Antennarius striatus TaxID=241820 RepID=UPI0035B14556